MVPTMARASNPRRMRAISLAAASSMAFSTTSRRRPSLSTPAADDVSHRRGGAFAIGQRARNIGAVGSEGLRQTGHEIGGNDPTSAQREQALKATARATREQRPMGIITTPPATVSSQRFCGCLYVPVYAGESGWDSRPANPAKVPAASKAAMSPYRMRGNGSQDALAE